MNIVPDVFVYAWIARARKMELGSASTRSVLALFAKKPHRFKKWQENGVTWFVIALFAGFDWNNFYYMRNIIFLFKWCANNAEEDFTLFLLSSSFITFPSLIKYGLVYAWAAGARKMELGPTFY
jgi:hypothetical protein